MAEADDGLGGLGELGAGDPSGSGDAGDLGPGEQSGARDADGREEGGRSHKHGKAFHNQKQCEVCKTTAGSRALKCKNPECQAPFVSSDTVKANVAKAAASVIQIDDDQAIKVKQQVKSIVKRAQSLAPQGVHILVTAWWASKPCPNGKRKRQQQTQPCAKTMVFHADLPAEAGSSPGMCLVGFGSQATLDAFGGSYDDGSLSLVRHEEDGTRTLNDHLIKDAGGALMRNAFATQKAAAAAAQNKKARVEQGSTLGASAPAAGTGEQQHSLTDVDGLAAFLGGFPIISADLISRLKQGGYSISALKALYGIEGGEKFMQEGTAAVTPCETALLKLVLSQANL